MSADNNSNSTIDSQNIQSPQIPFSTTHRRSSSILSGSVFGNSGSLSGDNGSIFGASGSGFGVGGGYAGSVFGGGSTSGSVIGPWHGLSGVPVGFNRLETEQHRLGINSIADIVDGHISSSPAYVSAIPSTNSLLSTAVNNGARAANNTNPGRGFLGLGGNAAPAPQNLAANQAAAATAGFKAPTTKDIPPVTLTPIKKVSNAELRSYLKEIEDEYNTFYETRGPGGGIFGVAGVSEETSSVTGSKVGGGSAIGAPSATGGASVAGTAGRVPLSQLQHSAALAISKGVRSGAGSRRVSGYSASIQTSLSAVSQVLDSVLGPSDSASARQSLELAVYDNINDEIGSISFSDLASTGGDIDPFADGGNLVAEITPLSSVPKVFFETDFQLDNPRTFDIVSEKSTIVRPVDSSLTTPTHSKELANNAILQEKLSWYIDTVELHLIREISNASHSFFSALDDLRTINSQARGCVTAVQQLRSDLSSIDQARILAGAKSHNMELRRLNSDKLLQALDQVSLLLEVADEAETLLLKKEMEKCLEYLDAIDDLLCGKGASINTSGGSKSDGSKSPGDAPNPLVSHWTKNWKHPLSDIRSVYGLSELREQLITLRSSVGSEYAKTFTDVLIADARNHTSKVTKPETLTRLGKVLRKAVQQNVISQNSSATVKEVNMSYLNIDANLRKSLETAIQGLARSNNIQGALNSYRETVIKEAKNIVRRYLPSSSGSNSAKDNDDTVSISSNMTGRTSASDRSVSLAVLLREMSEEEFENMIGSIYTSLSELFRRISTQQKLLLDVSVTFASEQPASSGASSPIIDTSDLLRKVIDTSLTRIVKILNARREQNSTMSITAIVNFYSLSVMFLAECEAIVGLDIDTTLGNTITTQLKLFLNNLHKMQESEISSQMDKDQWKEEDITPEFQSLVDRMVLAGKKDPYQWVKMLRTVLNENDEAPPVIPEIIHDTQPNDASADGTKKNRKLYIGDSVFTIPIASIQAATILEQYMQLVVLLPHLAAMTLAHTANFISLYNTKATQLILGAGATRTAALKHITARHLALCSQGLNVFITLIPYIKEYGKRHLGGSSLNTNGGNSNVNSPRGSIDGNADQPVVLDDFDRAMKELKAHQAEIHQKFITLLSDKMNHHAVAIRKMNWATTTSSPEYGSQPNKYMQSLVKDTTVLAKILNSLLPKSTYIVCLQIFFLF